MATPTLYDKVYDANLADVLADKGYSYFTKGNYNLNIIAIRKGDKTCTNSFDGVLVVEYSYNNKWYKEMFLVTTLPGLRPLDTPINPKGCAILVPGQYRGTFKLGYHKGTIEALVQNKPVSVYRDNNKDLIYDYDPKTIEIGMFGINIHPAGEDSKQIDSWSAGCQVFKRKNEFKRFLDLCKKAKDIWGNSFTYTLLEEQDLI